MLSFATPNRQFQFEYYSEALSLNGAVRDLSFSFTASADIGNLSFELQQPATAQAFTSDPVPSATQVRQDGLTYVLYDVGALSVGTSRSLQASYTRSTDELSVNTLASVEIPSLPEQAAVEVGGSGLRDNLGLILIAGGALLLLASLGYWFWSQRSVVVPEPTARRTSARPRPTSSKRPAGSPQRTQAPAKAESLAPYCHRCGTKLRDDALFCHACGAERRAD